MTKQDILGMRSAREIMKTLFTNSALWDDDVNEHLKKIAAAETETAYGSDSFFPTPNKRKATQHIITPKTEVDRMTEQEALEIIKAEYPEFTKHAEQSIKDGESVVQLLSMLESFY